jgi:hypothetical protein
MTVTLIVLGSLLLIWVLLHLKLSRPDGNIVRKSKMHPYRTMLGYILETRNGSVVLFDTYVRAEKLLAYLEQIKGRFHADITHALVAAVSIGGFENPKMNQFVVGRRTYERKDWWVTFSMKRKAMDTKAKVSAVKLKIAPSETFESFCKRVNERIGVERTDRKTRDDKELGFFASLPRPIIRFCVSFIKWLDYYNLVPGSFIHPDGMYTSVFVANLGSLKMGAGYHHLFEWGNCPLFMMVGQIEEKPVVEDGKVVPAKILHIRWTYDERIDDGLTARFGIESSKAVLEDPFNRLGCLKPDGSDAIALGSTADKG